LTMIRALIMDFDGLILDTEGPAYQAWLEIFQEYQAELPLSVWETWIGGSPHGFDPCGYLTEQTGYSVDREGLTRRALGREEELIEAKGVLPGVEEYVADAKRLGLKLGLASSSDCDWVFKYLEKLGLRDKFDCIKCADDVEKVKPAPDLYLAVLEGLGVPAEEAFAMEDSPNGITSAQAAGLFCVAVPNALTLRLHTNHADMRLDSLADVPLDELLSRVQAGGQ
jgi:HAD superfamily hydrolase (TIGR01509 family)